MEIYDAILDMCKKTFTAKELTDFSKEVAREAEVLLAIKISQDLHFALIDGDLKKVKECYDWISKEYHETF